MPPLAIEATRCSTSMGIPEACALAMNWSAMAPSAMLMPPEADPVMPASAVTEIASLTRGFGIAFRPSATVRKPAREAMTAPKPYSEAVFIVASRDPLMAGLALSAKDVTTGRHARAKTLRIPTSRAPSTAQMAVLAATGTLTGLAAPTTAGLNETDSP